MYTLTSSGKRSGIDLAVGPSQDLGEFSPDVLVVTITITITISPAFVTHRQQLNGPILVLLTSLPSRQLSSGRSSFAIE